MNQGCLRPLLVSSGIMTLLFVVLVAVYWDTFALMFANMTSMGEGAETARAMRGPDDLLAYLADHPEDVSMAVYDVGAEDAGLFVHAEAPRPVAGLTRLLVLAEYARQAEAGVLDSSATVPLSDLRRRVLPGTDQGAHARAVAAWRDAGALGPDSTLTLAQAAGAMMTHHDNAAADLLIERVTRDSLRALAARLGLPALDAPFPNAGLYLSWNNHTMETPPEDRLAAYEGMDAADYDALVQDLATVYRTDDAFHAAETARLTEQGTDLSLREQRALAQATFPRGTAAAYADLLARALSDSLVSPAVSRRVVAALERPLADTTGALTLRAVGSESGSFPGLVSFAGFARRRDADAPRVAVLLVRGLPMSVFYHLMQTGIDKGLQVQLLGDPAFADTVRAAFDTP